MSAHAEHVVAFSAVAGSTVELTIAQVWNSLGSGQLEVSFTTFCVFRAQQPDLDIQFHGHFGFCCPYDTTRQMHRHASKLQDDITT